MGIKANELLNNRLGKPPAEASKNLVEPEVFTTSRVDRRSKRIVPLAIKITPELDAKIRDICARDGLLLVELIEKSVACYEDSRSSV
jgi:hypothetical protein